MQYRDCNSIADIVREVFDLIRNDSSRFTKGEVLYYFRGENRNFKVPNEVPRCKTIPGIYREDGHLEHESDFFNEALRTYPEEFSRDKSTFERLTRLQHFGFSTRLADVTQNLFVATAFACMKGYDDPANLPADQRMGVVHVYRINNERIKYSTGDTVTALSKLAMLSPDKILVDDLN